MAKKRIVIAVGHKDLGTNLPEQKAEKHGVGHRGFLRSVRDFRMGGDAFP